MWKLTNIAVNAFFNLSKGFFFLSQLFKFFLYNVGNIVISKVKAKAEKLNMYK